MLYLGCKRIQTFLEVISVPNSKLIYFRITVTALKTTFFKMVKRGNLAGAVRATLPVCSELLCGTGDSKHVLNYKQLINVYRFLS